MSEGLILQAWHLPRALDSTKARRIVTIVATLDGDASFRKILREAARANIIRDNKTLRRYLDLLVAGNILRVRTRDVGSVQLQQLYSVTSKRPKVMVGLAILRRRGLNWDVPAADMQPVLTDFDGLTRAQISDSRLMACLEDCLIHEFQSDARRNTGTVSFVVAMISTRKLDLPYLLRRADEMRVGRALRLLLNRILETVSSRETEAAASVFMAVRTQFLKIARQYAQSGFWKLVDEKGVGAAGIGIVRSLTTLEVIMAAGKQLGVTG